MSVQLLSGAPLLVGGAVALHSDCCCTPSCFPDICAVPSATNCYQCYDPDCDGGSCLEWQTIEVAIDEVGDVVTIPSWIPVSCWTGFNCNCDVFNSSFVHDFANGCSTLWTVREVSPPFPTFDTCGTRQTGACNNWQITRQVFIRVATVSEQVSFTTGVKSSLVFPNAFTLTSGYPNDIYVCTNYDILPGHYVIVQLVMTGRVGSAASGTVYGNTKYFLYSFGNGTKIDVSCADDQYYPGCGPYIGGEATLVASSRFTRATIGGTPTYYADCDDIDELCQLGEATVTVEAPILTDCPEEPPPPPPP